MFSDYICVAKYPAYKNIHIYMCVMDVIFISHIFPLFSKSGEANSLLNCPLRQQNLVYETLLDKQNTQYIQKTLKLYFEKTGFPVFLNYG